MCMSITVSLKISVTCSRAYLQKRHLHVNVLLQMNPAWNGISRRSVSLFPRVRQSRVRSAGSADWAGSAGLRINKRPPLAVFRTRPVAISQGLRSVSLFPCVRQFRVRSAVQVHLGRVAKAYGTKPQKTNRSDPMTLLIKK